MVLIGPKEDGPELELDLPELRRRLERWRTTQEIVERTDGQFRREAWTRVECAEEAVAELLTCTATIELLDRLEAAERRSTALWIRTAPTEEGWYWICGEERRIERVRMDKCRGKDGDDEMALRDEDGCPASYYEDVWWMRAEDSPEPPSEG